MLWIEYVAEVSKHFGSYKRNFPRRVAFGRSTVSLKKSPINNFFLLLGLIFEIFRNSFASKMSALTWGRYMWDRCSLRASYLTTEMVVYSPLLYLLLVLWFESFNAYLQTLQAMQEELTGNNMTPGTKDRVETLTNPKLIWRTSFANFLVIAIFQCAKRYYYNALSVELTWEPPLLIYSIS